ncbi:MAG: hypothetical protein P8X50_06875 [Maritimibacter sp.]
MTNRIAIVLGLLIAMAYLIDNAFFGGHSPLFLARKFYDFLDWVAFWR